MADRYQRPGWFTKHVFNNLVGVFTRMGISVWGSRVLEVPGRKTGEPRRTPVNLLTFDGRRYLVAPRGHTQSVREVRLDCDGDTVLVVVDQTGPACHTGAHTCFFMRLSKVWGNSARGRNTSPPPPTISPHSAPDAPTLT